MNTTIKNVIINAAVFVGGAAVGFFGGKLFGREKRAKTEKKTAAAA